MPLPLALRATERELRVALAIWRGVVFSTFVAPVLVLLALGIGLGGMIDEDPSRLGGLPYLDFVVPGLLVASAVQAASGFCLWPVMAGHRWLGFHHAQVTTPLRPQDVFVGHTLFASLRSGAQAAVFLVVGAVLGGVGSWWGILAIPVAMATAAAFATPLAAFAAWADMDQWFDVIMRVFVAPLFLFSGTLFAIEQLPRGLQIAAQLFPLFHGVELARSATTAEFDGGAAVGHLAVIGAYVAVGSRLGIISFRRRLGR